MAFSQPVYLPYGPAFMAHPHFMWCASLMHGNTSCGKGIQAYNAVKIAPNPLSQFIRWKTDS